MRTRLKEARKASGLSQHDASEALDVSIGTYRNWEQGRVVMNGEQLVKAADLYKTSVDFILMTDTASEITEREDKLVDLYRSITQDGQRTLLAIAETLSDIFGAGGAEA